MGTAHHAEHSPKGLPVARADVGTRVYLRPLLAILAFAGVQLVFFDTGVAAPLVGAVLGERWLLALAAFELVAWGAR